MEQATAQHFLEMLPEVIMENPDLIDEYFKVSDLIAIVQSSYAFTAFDEDDKIISMGGILPQVPGIGFIWMHWTSRFKKHARGIIKLTKEQIEIARKRLNLHRLESRILYNKRDHIKFNLLCGFEIECERLRMADVRKNDFVIASMIWED